MTPQPILRTLFALILLTIFAPSTILHAETDNEQRKLTYEQLEIFSNILSLLQDNYVEEIDADETLNGAIKGLLYSLDPHSAYLNPESFKELEEETHGEFSGIGIEVTIENDQLSIVSPIEGTPADKAGLKAKDIIVEIDGVKTKEMGAFEAVKRLRGPQGTEVSISIFREGWDELQKYSLVRDLIPLISVKAYSLQPGFIYSRITNFQRHTTEDYVEAIREIGSREKIRGIILDLRNNPGGLLNQAVSISDLFLLEGEIVSTQGRHSDQNLLFKARENDQDISYPLVVLVNEGSASASEIVAGAIQDHRRGIIVGTRTFGKGSVQTIIPLPNKSGLRLTTAKYYTPSGKSIQALGISPDVEVKFTPYQENPEQDKVKPKLREKDLENHFPGLSLTQDDTQTKDSDQKINTEKQLDKDNQLRTALNILKSIDLYFQVESVKN